MRARCTWVFASARSFNRNPSVRRASLSLRSQAPPFAGSRTPTAPGLEGRFLPVTPCALTQGRDPQLPVAGEIGVSKLKATLSGDAKSIARATNTLLRNSVSNFPAPAPCLSPQIASQGQHLTLEQNTQPGRISGQCKTGNFHPSPPNAVMLCAGSCTRCTNHASPLVSQVKWVGGDHSSGSRPPSWSLHSGHAQRKRKRNHPTGGANRPGDLQPMLRRPAPASIHP